MIIDVPPDASSSIRSNNNNYNVPDTAGNDKNEYIRVAHARDILPLLVSRVGGGSLMCVISATQNNRVSIVIHYTRRERARARLYTIRAQSILRHVSTAAAAAAGSFPCWELYVYIYHSCRRKRRVSNTESQNERGCGEYNACVEVQESELAWTPEQSDGFFLLHRPYDFSARLLMMMMIGFNRKPVSARVTRIDNFLRDRLRVCPAIYSKVWKTDGAIEKFRNPPKPGEKTHLNSQEHERRNDMYKEGSRKIILWKKKAWAITGTLRASASLEIKDGAHQSRVSLLCESLLSFACLSLPPSVPQTWNFCHRTQETSVADFEPAKSFYFSVVAEDYRFVSYIFLYTSIFDVWIINFIICFRHQIFRMLDYRVSI